MHPKRLFLFLLLFVFTGTLFGQSFPVVFDAGGDEYLFNCKEFGHEDNVFCIFSSTDSASGTEESYLVELNEDGLIDTIQIPGVSGPNNLYIDKDSSDLVILGADLTDDSILTITGRGLNGQFVKINSIALPGPILYLGAVRNIHGRYYILGMTEIGPFSDDVFLVELDSLSDSAPQIINFGLTHIPIKGAFDIVPYNHTGYLLSFSGYPVPVSTAENAFVLIDSGFVNYRAQTINNLFGITQFHRVNGVLYYSGGYINSHPSKPESHHDILIGIVDTVTDTSAQLNFKHFGGGKDTNEASGLNTFSITGNSLYVGGTSFPGYISPPLFPVDADFVVGKFDLALNEQWVRYLGFPGRNDRMMTLLALSDGGCLLAGTTYDYVNNTGSGSDLLFYRLDADGNIVTGNPKAPGSGIALKVFPNPTSSTLVIDPEQNQTGTFHLINNMGQKTGTWDIHDRTTLSVGHLPTGIYFYHFVIREGENTSGQVVIAR